MRRLLLLVCALLIPLVPLQAQEATAEPAAPDEAQAAAGNLNVVDAFLITSQTNPLIGEPFTVTVVVEAPANVEISTWPEFPEDDSLEVLEAGDITETEQSNTIVYQQDLQAVLWQTGDYLSPELLVGFRVNGGGQQFDPVRSIFVVVPSLLEAEPTPRPSLPGMDAPFIPRWVYGVIAGVAILILMILARIVQGLRQGLRGAMSATPLQVSITQLEDLKLQDLPPGVVYPLVADYMRRFLQDTFGIDAVEMTTAELIQELRQRDLLTQEQRKQLQQVLEQADLVKFARHQPDDEAKDRLINFTIKWLRSVSRYQRSSNA